MSVELTEKAEILASKTNIENQIILDIDGIPNLFGAFTITKIPKYGDPGLTYGQEGLFYGVGLEVPGQKPFIMLGGTTNNINQQIQIDKGGATSISRFNVKLIDKDGFMSEVLRPGNLLTDPLGTMATIYLNFKGGDHPEDSTRIMVGTIDSVDFGAGNVLIGIAASDQLRRQALYPQVNTLLNGAINGSVTTITVDSTNGLILPADIQRSFVRIDDEIMEFTGLTSTTITGITRGALGTIAAAHDDDKETKSFYRLEGDPIEVALKLMLSTGDSPYTTANGIQAFNIISTSLTVDNAIFFNDFDIEDKLSLVVGDTITITGAANGANNVVDEPIVGFGKLGSGSFIVVGATLVDEPSTAAELSAKSMFNVLNEGAGMTPFNVDVKQHVFLSDTFGASFPNYEFPIRDTMALKGFLDEEVFFPAGLITLPRKGRISVNIQLPPLAFTGTQRIDETNTKNASKIRIKRSVNENFYNVITYRYDEDILEEGRFKTGNINFSTTSMARIKNTGVKQLLIQSKGLVRNTATTAFVVLQSKRFLDRFRFAADSLRIEVTWKVGLKIEVGDSVVFGSEALQITNIKKGTRKFEPLLYEVTNRSLNIKKGIVTLNIVNVKLGINGRFALWSPASEVGTGSSTTRINLNKSFGTKAFEFESPKWDGLTGETVRVRSRDYIFDEEVTLLGFDTLFSDIMLVSALSSPPLEDYIVEAPKYPASTNSADNAVYKEQFVHWNPSVAVVSGSSQTVFTVAPGDIGLFFENSILRVHNADYSDDSSPTSEVDDVVVTDITSNTITVDRALGFTPDATHSIELIGFPDEGLPYRWT